MTSRLLHICIVTCVMCKVDNTTPISHNRANIRFHCTGTYENNGTERIYLGHLLELDKMGGSLYIPEVQSILTPSSGKRASRLTKAPNNTIGHHLWHISSRSIWLLVFALMTSEREVHIPNPSPTLSAFSS